MKFARIIGRVTLNTVDPAYCGPRFLIALPVSPSAPEPRRGRALSKGNSFVLYDDLGASEGDLVGYSDGGEASAPFAVPTPCDAYNAAILDQVNHFK